MSQNGIIGLLLLGLLIGGVVLLSKNSTTLMASPAELPAAAYNPNIKLEPRYHNKETRHIEWNDDGLPVKITIERDYSIGG